MTDMALAAGWSDLCRRIDQLGQELSNGEYEGTETDLVAHLADQVVCFLSWQVFHADPKRPFFHRQNDLVTQWGGPNADNVYRHARIDPRLRYRIRGKMHSCEQFIVALRAGFMHNPVWGTLAEVSASDMGIREGDDFEFVLGGDGTAPGCIAIPDGVQMVSIREYYFDWRPEEPATFTIECLDDAEAPGPLASDVLVARLDAAAEQIEQSFRYWNEYEKAERAARTLNSFAASEEIAKGLRAGRYAFCFYDLAPDEALVVDTDVAPAPYWSFELYTLGTFELVDPADRISSLNHTQTAIGQDGRIQLVVSSTDPGTANWLDIGAHRRGLLTYRWFWPTAELPPSPIARVVPVAEVTDDAVSTTARREVMAARRAHLAWRFRV